MTKAKLEFIIKEINKLTTHKEKLDYIDTVLETDYERNGYLEELIKIRNELNDKI